MSRARVNAFGISIDGYGAGPDQDLGNPMGVGGMALHQWVLGTKTFQKMHADFAQSLIGDAVGSEGVDEDFAARGFENVGAWILGRGEHLFAGIDTVSLGYKCTEHVSTDDATHVVLAK